LIKPVLYEKFAEKMDAMIEDITDQGWFALLGEKGGVVKIYVRDNLIRERYIRSLVIVGGKGELCTNKLFY